MTQKTLHPKRLKIMISLIYILGSVLNVWGIAALWIDGSPWVACLYGLVLFGIWKWRCNQFLPCLLSGFVAVLAWWLTLKPSMHRTWSSEYSRLPHALVEGEQVHLYEVRDFVYHNGVCVEEKWITRTVNLANLRGVDYVQNYWGLNWIAHPLASFDFGEEGRVCFSVETRRESHEGFSAVKGFFRQFELICLVGEERDFLGKRAQPGGKEEVYLYPLKIGRVEMRDLFLHYISLLNELHEKPQWYHAVTSNCTTALNIKRDGDKITNALDWRILFNGYFDAWIYDQNLMGKEVPFRQLKAQRRVDDIARGLSGQGLSAQEFSRQIRAGFRVSNER